VFVSSSQATILHADVDAFFASVEQRDDPRLRGRPVIVGGGVVMAASYEARAHGIRGGMGGGRARRLCPHAIVVPPRFAAYSEASRAVFDVFEETAPVVQGVGMEEAFLDVRGLGPESGSPAEIAARLRREVRERVGLPITVGVARTRLLAKLASRQGKPDGLLVVPPDGERAFLHPLPVEQLWGIGAATAARLHARGLTTAGEAARLTEAGLIAILGKASGRHVYALVNNLDPAPVQPRRRRGSFGAQRALGRPRPRSPAELDEVLAGLADRITRRMEASGRVGRTVTLRLRFGDYERATRSHTLPRSTAASETVLATARELLADAMPTIERRGLTLVGLAVGNLDGVRRAQLTLALDEPAGGPVRTAAPGAPPSGRASQR